MGKKHRKKMKKKKDSSMNVSSDPVGESSVDMKERIASDLSFKTHLEETSSPQLEEQDTLQDQGKEHYDQHPLLVQARSAFHQGNYQHVHRLLHDLKSVDLSEEDRLTRDRLKHRLSFDPVHLWFPIGMFFLWVFLFYRSLS